MSGAIPAEARGPILTALGKAPMSRMQIVAVALSVILNALDGFDVLAITFAAPAISQDWHINPVELGFALSSGLAGMAIGSLFVAPAGDRFGRRPLVLACLLVMAIGMLFSASAPGITSLCLWRLFTGIGIGTMIAAINAVAAEFANDRRRALAVALMSIGNPLGGIGGGFAAAALVQAYGWRSIFVGGGLATAAMLPIVWRWLPESFDHLVRQTGPRARRELERLLRLAGQPMPQGDAPEAEPVAGGAVRELLGRRYRTATLLLVTTYFLFILVYYFFSGWLPKMMSDLGHSTPDAIRTSAIMSVGGVLGGTALGWAAPRFGLTRLLTLALLGTGATLAAFGNARGLHALQAIAFIAGICIFGGIVGLYSLLALSFPARMRVTGTGLAIGVGRGGAVLGPLIGGFLINAGMRVGLTIALVGLFAPLSAVVLAILVRRGRRLALSEGATG